MAETLRTDLTARDRTRGAFASAQRNLDGFASKVTGIKTALTAAFAVAGVGAVTTFADRALEAADSIGKVADSVGLGTKSLQEYRFALGQAGLAQGEVDQGLTTFVKRFGELQNTGTGMLSSFLQRYSPELRRTLVAQESVDDALRVFIDRLGAADSAQQRAALGAAGFSRTIGVRLAAAFDDGGKSIDAAIQKANDFGLILSDRVIRDSERARDRLDELGRVITNTFTRVVAENAGAIARAVEKLTLGAVDLAKRMGVLDDQLEISSLSTADLTAAKRRLLDTLIDIRQEVDLGGDAFDRLAAATNAYNEVVGELDRRASRLVSDGGVGSLPAAIGAMTNDAETFRTSFVTPANLVDPLDSAINAMTDDAETFATVFIDAEGPVNNLATAAEKVGLAFAESFAIGTASVKSFDDAVKGVFASILDGIAKVLAKEAASFFVRLLFGGGSAGAGGGSGGGPTGSADGNVLVGGFTPFANGGVVNRPTLGLIGEAGQNEAVVPLPDGRRIPVELGENGPPVVIHQHFALGLNAEVRATVIQMLPEIREETTKAMVDARLRGGQTAQAFG